MPASSQRSLVAAAAAALIAAAMFPGGAGAAPPSGPPSPVEPNFAGPVLPPRPCEYEGDDLHEKRVYKLEGWKGPDYERYPGACERLRFAYGPIVVKPGQNDVWVEPVTIQSPRRNGYVTRFEPNLVLADGTVPPVERVHLHHGTWLSSNAISATGGGQSFAGIGPFAAAGEEKTIGTAPRGYGMPVKASDQWFLLYMVHSAVPQPMIAYITYDIDFVPADEADDFGIDPLYTAWLDVRPQAYPVFNVQRRFGGKDGECTWPREQCANFDPWGDRVVGQGQPGNDAGTDFELPARGEQLGPIKSFTGGTLIGIAGHLHPGGLTDNIDLVRDGRSRRIFTSEAIYWNRKNHRKPGGPPTSWDLSMTGTALPVWGIRVKPGDAIRINASYDTTHQATYENMGISVTAIAPNGADGKPTAPGLNPFKAPRDRSRECTSLKRRLKAPVSAAEDVGLQADRPALCDRGLPTHGHQRANGNYGKAAGTLKPRPGPPTREVGIANFQYLPGDLSTAPSSGIPQVELGTKLRFTNLEGPAIFHTITTCRFPCLGPTGASFPIADGQTSRGRRVDLDSSEMGVGTPYIGPAKQSLSWSTEISREAGYKPGEAVTYFCRIHPFMRGAFQVAK